MFTYGVHELESARVIPFYGGEVIENDNSLVAKRMNGLVIAMLIPNNCIKIN